MYPFHPNAAIRTKMRGGAGVVQTDEDRYSEAAIIEALDLTLKALGTDCIDMYQVHWRGNMTSVEETLRALDSARRQVHTQPCCFLGRPIAPRRSITSQEDLSLTDRLCCRVKMMNCV